MLLSKDGVINSLIFICKKIQIRREKLVFTPRKR